MATELPQIEGHTSPACRSCSAQTWIDGRYMCDESKLDEFLGHRKVSHYRPKACPKTSLPMTVASSNSQNTSSLLKAHFKNIGK